MKIENVKNSLFYKAIIEINYKREKLNFNNLIKKNIIDELKKNIQLGDDFWYSRAIYFINCFFADYSTPKSLNIVDIFEYCKKNKNSKLNEYIGVENIDEIKNINTISLCNSPSFKHHYYIVMMLESNVIIRKLFMLNILTEILKEREIRYHLNDSFTYIVKDTKYKINFNEKDIIISDNETKYSFKEKEFEKFIKTEELHDQPVELINMFFY